MYAQTQQFLTRANTIEVMKRNLSSEESVECRDNPIHLFNIDPELGILRGKDEIEYSVVHRLNYNGLSSSDISGDAYGVCHDAISPHVANISPHVATFWSTFRQS